jgi:hypothetical protein
LCHKLKISVVDVIVKVAPARVFIEPALANSTARRSDVSFSCSDAVEPVCIGPGKRTEPMWLPGDINLIFPAGCRGT